MFKFHVQYLWMTVQLPMNLLPGRYRLQVEGSVNDFNGGLAFSNETTLTLLQRSLTILVQIDRPLYCQRQTGIIMTFINIIIFSIVIVVVY